LDLLAMPALWPILIAMFVCYAPAAGVRGLWISPYVAEVHGAALSQIGIATLAMGLAMVAGNFVYGPIDRWVGTRKAPILVGNLTVALLLLSLWLIPARRVSPAPSSSSRSSASSARPTRSSSPMAAASCPRI
jgi:predicted MFS family arabinose efflux permease